MTIRGGIDMPILGQGTWRMGEIAAERTREVAALQLGIDLGMSLIDTAEMYGDAESVVGEAIRGRREQVFLVSKVLPKNASRRGTRAACERSLGKLGVDSIDLYLLHWQGAHPLEDTLATFAELVAEGKIGAFGVSNFDVADLTRAQKMPGGAAIAANQVLYNLTRRGPEAKLLAQCRTASIALMAYTPIERGSVAGPALSAVAERHRVSPAQVAIAWTLRHDGVVSIPKASDPEHVRQNAAAFDLVLDENDLRELDAAFPRRTSAIETL